LYLNDDENAGSSLVEEDKRKMPQFQHSVNDDFAGLISSYGEVLHHIEQFQKQKAALAEVMLWFPFQVPGAFRWEP
jgi:hypothetical protein